MIKQALLYFFISLAIIFQLQSQTFEELNKILANTNDACTQLDATTDIARLHLDKSFIDSLLKVANQSIKQCNNLTVRTGFVSLYLRNNPDDLEQEEHLDAFIQGLRDTDELEDCEEKFELRLNYGRALNQYGLHSKAIEVIGEKFFPKSLLSQYSKLYARRYFALGLYHYLSKQLEKAIYYYKESIKVCEDYGVTKYLTVNYNNISQALRQTNDIEGSLKYLLEGLPHITNESPGVTSLYHNIGVRYRELGILDSAEIYISKSLAHSDALDGRNYSELSNIYLSQEEYDKALDYLNMEETIAFQTKQKGELDNRKGKLGKVAYEKGEFSKAMNLFREAIEISRSDNDLDYDNRRKYYQNFLRSKWMVNGDEGMVTFLDDYGVVLDSLIELNNRQSVSKAKVNFEVERKERQFALEQAESALALEEEKNQTALMRGVIVVAALIIALVLALMRIRKLQILGLKQKLQNQNYQLIETLEKLEAKTASKNTLEIDYIFIDGNRKIKFKDIFYLEGRGSTTTFYTTKGIYIDSNLLLHWQETLEKTNLFFRVHKNYVVSLSKIFDSGFNSITFIETESGVKEYLNPKTGFQERINFGRKYYQQINIRKAIENHRQAKK